MNQLEILPSTKTYRMPPLRKSITLDLLVPTDKPTGYRSLRKHNDDLIDEVNRLWKCCVGGFCLCLVVGFLFGLYAGAK